MAEFDRQADFDPQKQGIERELARAMSPVSAPAGLWAAIHRPRETRPARFSLRWALWPAMAFVLLLTLAGALRSHTLDKSAPASVAASSENCHTPVFVVRETRSVRRLGQEGCMACHFSMPGTLLIVR